MHDGQDDGANDKLGQGRRGALDHPPAPRQIHDAREAANLHRMMSEKVGQAMDCAPLIASLEAAEVRVEVTECPRLLGELERLKAILWSRMVTGSCGAASSQLGADDVLLTLPQVAERLAIPTGYAYELARRDVLPVVRFGKYVRVSQTSLTRWIAQQTTPQRRIDNDHPGLHSGTVTLPRQTRMPAKARPKPGPTQRVRTRPVRLPAQTEPNRLSQVKPAVEEVTAKDLIFECSE